MVESGYYGNEGFALAWNRIRVCQTYLFITTVVPYYFLEENMKPIFNLAC